VIEFPRLQRFVLGERFENAALDLLDLLVEAQFRRDKQELLRRANLALVRLRHLLRLAHGLHLFGVRRCEFCLGAIRRGGRGHGRARQIASGPRVAVVG